jgi:transcriptional regulator with XRE-family HTH domain
MNQEEFAQRIGISQGYVSSMERGEKEVGIEILLKISREYGKSLEWLLLGTG